MKKSILEEKREKLGINRLSTVEQKKLFNDFVSAGGEVVDLSNDEKAILNLKLEEWIREKERQYNQHLIQEKLEQDRTRNILREEVDKTPKTEERLKSSKKSPSVSKKEENPTPYFLSRLASKISCILYGIFPLFKEGFTKRFIDLTFYDLQTMLLDSQQILYTVFSTDEKLTERIRKFLLRAGYTYYFELAYRFYILYDERFFINLFEQVQDLNPVYRAKPYFIELFKKILAIYRYYPTITKAFSKILEEEARICNTSYDINKARVKKLEEICKFVFEKYFPRLLQLIDFYYKEELLSGGRVRSFKEFLNITEKDVLGYWNKFWEEKEKEREQEKKMKKENLENLNNNKEEIKKDLAEEIQKGLDEIAGNINFFSVLNYFVLQKDPRMFFSVNDKLFVTWVLLEHFDKNYSPLFVGGEVIFQVTFSGGKRVDVKSNLKDLYFDIDSSYKNFKEYLDIVIELNKRGALGSSASKELFSLTQKLEFQRASLSKRTRDEIATIIKNMKENFFNVLYDYNTEKKIVLNPEDVIKFDVEFFGNRKKVKSKIIDLFSKGYNFLSAFYFLLLEGDLSGTLISVMKPRYLKWSGMETQNEAS